MAALGPCLSPQYSDNPTVLCSDGSALDAGAGHSSAGSRQRWPVQVQQGQRPVLQGSDSCEPVQATGDDASAGEQRSAGCAHDAIASSAAPAASVGSPHSGGSDATQQHALRPGAGTAGAGAPSQHASGSDRVVNSPDSLTYSSDCVATLAHPSPPGPSHHAGSSDHGDDDRYADKIEAQLEAHLARTAWPEGQLSPRSSHHPLPQGLGRLEAPASDLPVSPLHARALPLGVRGPPAGVRPLPLGARGVGGRDATRPVAQPWAGSGAAYSGPLNARGDSFLSARGTATKGSFTSRGAGLQSARSLIINGSLASARGGALDRGLPSARSRGGWSPLASGRRGEDPIGAEGAMHTSRSVVAALLDQVGASCKAELVGCAG